MKTTRWGTVDAGSTASSGSASGPAGGDLGGGYPAPQVTGLDGKPFSAPGSEANGDIIVYDSATGTWLFQPPAASGLSSITDTATTITPVTDLTVPIHSLSGTTPNATLAYVTPSYGGEETLHTVAASGAAQTLNPSAGNVHDVTLTAACTITLGTCETGFGNALTIILRQGGTGSYTVTWPGSVSWVTGSAPTLKTAVGAVDVVTLFTVDGGTTWGGVAVGSSIASPLTTKGDIWGYSTTDDRIPVGSDGDVLTADSSAALGVSYQTPTAVGPQHVHVDNVLYSGDASTTDFTLPAAPVDAYSVSVFVAGSRSQDWSLTGTLLDTLSFGSAPASGTDNIAVDIVAVLV